MQISQVLKILSISFFAAPIAWAEPFDQKLYDAKARTYSPEESMAMIEMQPGYKLELVASEPMVEEPAAMAWDGDGKLYVAELNTYMQDIDGKNQHDPICRVVLLEDTDDDGVMDKRSVFVDKLVLPRMIQPIDDRVIIRETNTFDLHSYRDTDGDGVADEKKLVYEGGRRGGNLEHQPSGLEWNIDNWMYVTYTNKRYRWTGDRIEAQDIPSGSGQWGVTHDDVGRNFFCTGGGENPAMAFQRPLVYGKISLPGEQENGFRQVFPLVAIPDVQGGRGRFRAKELTLNNFTGCAGQHIFRGHRMGDDFYGDYIFPDRVGRLLRRAKGVKLNGKIVLKNATPGTEFMRSRDANFRPVNASTGPDGCLYICDMYRGIIQEGNWVRKGSYLRGVVENYGLDKNIKRGRIYRVVHESTERDTGKPKMLKASTTDLVKNLSHTNGWWRNTAQKLIVVRGDDSAIPALEELARNGKNPKGRMHALWTLDGLGKSSHALLSEKLKDTDSRVRAAAIRISEPILATGGTAAMDKIAPLADDPDVDVAIQLILSLGHSGAEGGEVLIERISEMHKDNPNVKAIIGKFQSQLAEAKRKSQQNKFLAMGETHYQTICVACHAKDGKGTPAPGTGMTLGAPLVDSSRVTGRKDIPIKIMLKGMTGELDGKNFPGPMLPLETYDDEWIASVLTYVRSSWGNKADLVTPDEVAAVRASIKDRKEMWQSSEILAMAPIPNKEMEKWKFTASHNAGSCKNAIDGKATSRWDTGGSQVPGMWFRFDMGKRRKLTGITLHTEGSPADYPREYTVEVSNDARHWVEIVAKRTGSGPVTDIVFPEIERQYVRISQHGKANGKHWSIHQLEVFAK